MEPAPSAAQAAATAATAAKGLSVGVVKRREVLRLGDLGSVPADTLFELYLDTERGDLLTFYQTRCQASIGGWVYDAAACLAKYLETEHFRVVCLPMIGPAETSNRTPPDGHTGGATGTSTYSHSTEGDTDAKALMHSTEGDTDAKALMHSADGDCTNKSAHSFNAVDFLGKSTNINISNSRANSSGGCLGSSCQASQQNQKFGSNCQAEWIEDGRSCCHDYRCLVGRRVVELGAGTGVVGIMAGYLGADVIVTDMETLVPLLEYNVRKNEHLINLHQQRTRSTTAAAAEAAVPPAAVPAATTAAAEAAAAAAAAAESTACCVTHGSEQSDSDLHSNKTSEVRDPVSGRVVCRDLHWGSDISEMSPPDLLVLANCVYYESSLEPLLQSVLDLTTVRTLVLLCYEIRTPEIGRLIDRWHLLAGIHFHVTDLEVEKQRGLLDEKFAQPFVKFFTFRRRVSETKNYIAES